jgi:hypothetical protein
LVSAYGGYPSKLNPGTVEFLNQFSPAELRDIFFEPTLTEQIVGLGIDLFFPTPTGKVKAAATISEAVSKEILESLEKKFGAALAEGTAKGSSLAGKTIDDLSSAGKMSDPADKSGQLSLAGRALQKHGSREGSAFPSVLSHK